VNDGGQSSWPGGWRARPRAPADGTYRFEADRVSRAGLWIDERPIFDETEDQRAELAAGTVELSAGEHSIRVRLQDRGQGGPRLYLYWTPPGGTREVVPGRVLYPPRPEGS